MPQFMVEFDLPDFTEAFIALIPEQRMKINELLEEGKISSYSLSMDRAKLWCLVNADSETGVMDIIADFPLIAYMHPTVYELMFSNSVTRVPSFSLN
jgi:Muconolactone delta-isomerase